jgi:hypothetical protein
MRTGIIPRITASLLQKLQGENATPEWTMTMSYLEIYNEVRYCGLSWFGLD